MIAHVPGYLAASDVAEGMRVTRKAVHRLASRHGWRKAKRPGHREVYYCIEDILRHAVT